jgi:hypothetical protein
MHWLARDELLLPNQAGWGRGYGGQPFTQTDLDETYGYISGAKAAGYGQEGYGPRLFSTTPGFEAHDRHFLLPPGFDAMGHKDRIGADPLLLEPDSPTSLECRWQVPAYLQEFYDECGWAKDQHGRPCNPHGLQLVNDPRIGLNTNLGSGFEAGETVVVDVVAEDDGYVLFTHRLDMGKVIPSLTGGYSLPQDYGVSIAEWRVGNRPITKEGIFAAARRVVKVKTGVELPVDAEYEIVWGIRPASSRHTWNFWTLTYTVRVRLRRGASRSLTPATDDKGEPRGTWHRMRDVAGVVERLWPDHRRSYEASTR